MTTAVRRVLNLMTQSELKELCDRLDLRVGGSKQELKQRAQGKLLRDNDGDQDAAVRELLETSDVSVEDWRFKLEDATGSRPGRSYDDLVEFVLNWADGLLDDEDDDDDGINWHPQIVSSGPSVATSATAPWASTARPVERDVPSLSTAALSLVATDGPLPPPLKNYQTQGVVALARLTAGDPERRGGLLCLPTGGGKTKTAVWWAMEHHVRRGARVLWLAARQELVDQAFETFVSHAPLVREAKPRGIRVRRIVADSEAAFDGDVVVASVQTLQKRMAEGARGLGDIAAIVFDEAHHAPAQTYHQLLRDLRYETRVLVGLSATPTRTSESERPILKRLFPAGVVHQATYESLMHQGYLAKPVQHLVTVDGDDLLVLEPDEVRHVEMWRDLPQSALKRLAASTTRLRTIADYVARRKAELRPMLIFAINQDHAKDLQRALAARNVSSACVLDATANRSELVEALRRGQLDALVNVQVLTEGTDIPALNGVVITRPTMSRSLYQQMLGRGSRGPKLGGTERFFLVDFTANLSQFGDFLAYRYALETELPRELLEPRPPTPSLPVAVSPQEADASAAVRQAIADALADLRGTDPGSANPEVAGWYTFLVGDGASARIEELLVFEPDRSAVASAVKQLADRVQQGLSSDAVEAIAFEIWNRELFARSVALRKFLTLGESMRAGRSATYVPIDTLVDGNAIPADHGVDVTFSDDESPPPKEGPLPTWLASHLEAGGLVTLDWGGNTRLGIERVGPGLVGLLGRFGAPVHERDVYRVDIEKRRDGDHDVTMLVARADHPSRLLQPHEVFVKVPESESARFTDVFLRAPGSGERVELGELRMCAPTTWP
jgi:superfamily II DNA or RNA helicase